ncbi:MAG: hypothetical protein ABI833_16800, partial [Acidobacteriota bacterium]
MDREQQVLLRRRLRAALRQQPKIESLRALLLTIGGVEFVAPTGFDPDIALLIDTGLTMAGSVKYEIMERSESHKNAARLWLARESGLTGIGTGYALSSDGLWRQHSWGLRRAGILETTIKRVKYFGRTL